MTTRNSILVWWTSRVSLSQRRTTTCRCQARLSSEFATEGLQGGQRRNFIYFGHNYWCLCPCYPTGLSWHWVATLVWVMKKRRRISRRSSCPRRMATNLFLYKLTFYMIFYVYLNMNLSPLAMWWAMHTSLPPLTSIMSNWHQTRISL